LQRGPPARRSIRPISRPTLGAPAKASVCSSQLFDVTNTPIEAFRAARTHSFSRALWTSSDVGTSKRRYARSDAQPRIGSHELKP
jgi:hypothetical protein